MCEFYPRIPSPSGAYFQFCGRCVPTLCFRLSVGQFLLAAANEAVRNAERNDPVMGEGCEKYRGFGFDGEGFAIFRDGLE